MIINEYGIEEREGDEEIDKECYSHEFCVKCMRTNAKRENAIACILKVRERVSKEELG
jgi:hypothetical protein